MHTTSDLRQEHDTIRQWLDRLEALLPVSQERRLPVVFVLRKITDRLAAHLAHEAELYERLGQELWQPASPASAIRHEHEDVTTTLNILDQLLTKGHSASLETFQLYIQHLLDTLREHMADEETQLFPLIDRLLADTGESASPISSMTINRILQMHPETQPIFHRFNIHREEHGHEFLDEAAWYCGVCMEEIERALRAAIARREHDVAAT